MTGLGIYLTYSCNQSCPYCFKENVAGKMISVEDFKIFCEWFAKNDLRGVKIAGGEPTSHPHFVQLLDMFRRINHDCAIQVITNLICNEEKVKALRHCNVLVNSSPPHTPKQRALFEKNLEMLVAAAGTRVTLSHTRYALDQEDDHIFRYCRDLHINHVRMDFARASLLRQNDYVTLEQAKETFKYKLLDLSKRLGELGVVVNFDCTTPVEIFTKEEIEDAKLQRVNWVKAEANNCCMVYINPDLTISSCPFRVIDERRLDEFPDLGMLYGTVAMKIKKKIEEGKKGPVLCMAERFM